MVAAPALADHRLLTPVYWAAETAANGSVDLNLLSTFLQLGVVGVLFVMVISKRFVVPKWTLDDATARYEAEIATREADIRELKTTVNELQALTRDQLIPALTRANQLQADYVAEMAAAARRPSRRASS